MKKIFLCSSLIIMFLSLIGCKNTQLVFVDYDFAEENGIKITKFTDNPIFTYIDYNYSEIENFSTNNIDVTLVRNVIPLDEWETEQRLKYSPRQIYLQNQLLQLTTVDNFPIKYLKPKNAIITENIPGHLKILSIDDIGAYQIKYIKNK